MNEVARTDVIFVFMEMWQNPWFWCTPLVLRDSIKAGRGCARVW